MSLKYKAVIFDVDGVIIDYEPLLVDMTLEELRFYGIVLTKKQYLKEFYKQIAGNTVQKVVENINLKFGTKIYWQDFLEKRKSLRKKYFPHMKLQPNILNLLKFFAKNKLKIGLATSSDTYKLNYMTKRWPTIMRYFKIRYTADDVINGKPNPEIFLKTAKALGINPKEILIIEDSINGLIAANDGGFDFIILKNPYIKKSDYVLYKPKAVVKDLSEIIKLLESDFC